MQETIDALISALDAIARANESTGECSQECASVNIEDEDCDCGYMGAADDVAAFARDAIKRANVQAKG